VHADRLLDEVLAIHGRGCIQRIASGEPRVTSIDVAKRAGVSQSTVSLVLSGKGAGRISARTEAVVRAAADELGYRTNVAARALRMGSARTIGLVVPDVTHPFFGRLLRGAQAAAWQQGYAVVLADAASRARGAPVPITSVRTGSVPGTHELLFDAQFEQVRLVHEARDRRVFAEGALAAARWIIGRQGIFTMEDLVTTSHPSTPEQ